MPKLKICPVCSREHSGGGVTCSMECREKNRSPLELVKSCEVPGCPNEFVSRSATARYCSEQHQRTCLSCGSIKPVSRRVALEKEYSCKSCAQKLAAEKAKTTLQERYGVTNVSQIPAVQRKKRETSLERYGVEHWIRSTSVQEKAKASLFERYGAESAFGSEEIRKKAQRTHEERHGVDNPFKLDSVQKHIRTVMEERYGAKHPYQNPEILAKARETLLKNFGVDNPMRSELIKEQVFSSLAKNLELNGAQATGKISKLNLELAKALEEHFPGVKISHEKRLPGASFDLAIEEHKLLIELNPTVSHNSMVAFRCIMESCAQPCEKHNPTAKDYHYKRALLAQAHGYSLVQLYSWNSMDEKLKLVGKRLAKLGRRLSARKLTSKKISQAEANRFLGQYHIQGSASRQAHCYGLFQNEELLAVATFGKSRFRETAELEWIRYAVKEGVLIHGGANRLFELLLSEIDPKSVISYVDFDHTTAKQTFLNSSGFEELTPTGAARVWSKGSKRVSQNSLIAQGADRLIGTSYGTQAECGLNNEEIMVLEGWLPVYTAGNRVFLWES